MSINHKLFYTDGSFETAPEQCPGKAKYCGFRGTNNGLYTTKSFGNLNNLNPKLTELLVKSANNSLGAEQLNLENFAHIEEGGGQ